MAGRCGPPSTAWSRRRARAAPLASRQQSRREHPSEARSGRHDRCRLQLGAAQRTSTCSSRSRGHPASRPSRSGLGRSTSTRPRAAHRHRRARFLPASSARRAPGDSYRAGAALGRVQDSRKPAGATPPAALTRRPLPAASWLEPAYADTATGHRRRATARSRPACRRQRLTRQRGVTPGPVSRRCRSWSARLGGGSACLIRNLDRLGLAWLSGLPSLVSRVRGNGARAT